MMMMKSKISKDVKIISGTLISTSHWVRKWKIFIYNERHNQQSTCITPHSSGMVFFFVFWGTLLFHIWPPSLYWPRLAWEQKDSDRERFNMTRWTFPGIINRIITKTLLFSEIIMIWQLLNKAYIFNTYTFTCYIYVLKYPG